MLPHRTAFVDVVKMCDVGSPYALRMSFGVGLGSEVIFMNKAFVREPEPDERAFCPVCGAIGVAVDRTTLDHHISPDSRSKLGMDGWFCPSSTCDVAYFDLMERVVLANELRRSVFPKSLEAPICPCFGFTLDDLDTAIDRRSPELIRELLAKSKSSEANCAMLAANGRCCMQEVQRLYIRGIQRPT
jgi:hypothetical protein